MDVKDMISQARDVMTVKRVFGDPYESDGVTVIPAARVRGGAGGGESTEDKGTGHGAGFGLDARPAGAFVIRDGKVSWEPAVDVNRVILLAPIVAATAALLVQTVIRRRAEIPQR
jgi:uncharacterized spore protein YtfJ